MDLDNTHVLDCEVYPNYFLAAFKSLRTGKVTGVEVRGDETLSDDKRKKLTRYMEERTTFGFNSRNYDLMIISAALEQKSTDYLYKLSKEIIEGDAPIWDVEKHHEIFRNMEWQHFDLQEPAPGVMVGLKLYGGRMHSQKLQDLPYDPHEALTDSQMDDIKLYCINDLDTTIDLFEAIREQMQLRVDMSKEYSTNLMSKSDAQIAEAVLKHGESVYKPNVSLSRTLRYKPPEYIKFTGEQLNDVLAMIRAHEFELMGNGSIKLPDEFKKLKLTIGSADYTLGIGGLHSKESAQAIMPTINEVLVERDVTSYYPTIILNRGLYPPQFGEKFLDKYRGIVERRIEAKLAGDKVVDKALKIVINGSFGKLGSKYSALYAPDLMLAVTMTGQLSLLMLIERLTEAGLRVVSANTDGFVTLVPKALYPLYDAICFDWELDTSFNLEETRYKSLFSRDVNTYLAVMEDGHKGKGMFADPGLMKNPQAYVCVEAAIAYLTEGTAPDEYIRGCEDVTKFLTVRRVNKGAVWRDEYLGKVVRWVWTTDGEMITYKHNGNKVATSDGAWPMMELGEIPDNLDYDKYVEATRDIISSVGAA